MIWLLLVLALVAAEATHLLVAWADARTDTRLAADLTRKER